MDNVEIDVSIDFGALAREDRPPGRELTNGPWPRSFWLFNESGRYAVVIDQKLLDFERMNPRKFGPFPEMKKFPNLRNNSEVTRQQAKQRSQQSITIYDFLERKAYAYMENEITNIHMSYFYWHNDQLILVDLHCHYGIFCFELNHEQRNVHLVATGGLPNLRNMLISSNDYKTQPLFSLDNIEYFGQHLANDSLLLIPKDPYCNRPPKQFLIQCPYIGRPHVVDGIERITEYSDNPMSYKSSLFYFKIIKVGDGDSIFRLDQLIEIDLTKLEDIYGKDVDRNQVKAKQDITAYSEVTLEYEAVADGASKIHQGSASYGPRFYSAKSRFQHIQFWDSHPYFPSSHKKIHVYDLKFKKVVEVMIPESRMGQILVNEVFDPSEQIIRIECEHGKECKYEILWKQDKPLKPLEDIVKRRLFYGEKIPNIPDEIASRFL